MPTQRVLVIEDDAKPAELVRMSLERDGFDILLAKNWALAVQEWLDDAGDRLSRGTDRAQLVKFVLTVMEGGVMNALQAVAHAERPTKSKRKPPHQ